MSSRSSRRYNARRQIAEARGDKINKFKLAERDHWICGVCLESILSGDDLSIDHITPIAASGKHVWHNVRAAHVYCNSSRQAKVRRKKRKERREEYPVGYGMLRHQRIAWHRLRERVMLDDDDFEYAVA